jgi:ABC-2 type transport system ATP-binding protein
MVAALRYSDVVKSYGRKRALDGLSLEVPRGEIVGLLGPNGAGKTTAIHIAIGLLRADGGSGELLGRPFGDHSARQRLGFLPDAVALYHRTVRGTLRFAAELYGIAPKLVVPWCRTILERLEIDAVADAKVQKLSRGMQQRVGLAQALVNDPELLILDEPTSSLDPAARVVVRDLLLELRSQGKSVMMSSHLLSEVEAVCDRVVFVVDGRVVRTGSVRELLTDEARFEIVYRTASDGSRAITVLAAEQRAKMEQIWSDGGTVIEVHPVRRSLEQVFLELTQRRD